MITTLIPPGAPDLAAAIMAALAIGDVELESGAEYVPLERIDIPSERWVYSRGPRPARIVAGWEMPPGGWDDPRNAILRIEGAPAPAGAGTITLAIAPKDSLELLVADDSDITAGDWLRVVSGGGPDDQYQQTDSPLLEFVDLVQVADTYLGGPVVPLRRPLAMHHRAGAVVQGWAPARGVRIDGVELVAGGAAVGIYADGLDVEVRNVCGSGFSRALINAGEVRGLDVRGVRGLGGNNSLVFLESAAIGRVLDVSNDEAGDRYALTGIPRGLVTIRRRCTGIDLDQIHLVHGCIGVQWWGGQGIRFGSISARDMCPDMARERDHELNADHEYGAGAIGAGFDSGTNVVSFPSASEFAYGVTITSLYVENCFGAHPADVAVYLHDTLDLSVGSCVINNKGLSPYVPGAPSRKGAIFSDCQGHVTSLRCTGVDEPLRLRGFWTPSIWHYAFEGAPGWSGPPNLAGGPSIIFEAGSPGPIGVVEVHNGRNAAFDTQFQGTPDFGLEIGAYRLEWFEAHGVTLADGGAVAFNVGELAAIDPASPGGERHILPSFEGAASLVVVASGGPWDVATGLHLVCPLPSARVDVKCTGDAVAAGAQLVASATPGRARARLPGDTGAVIGVALRGKPAGAEALVPIGPAS